MISTCFIFRELKMVAKNAKIRLPREKTGHTVQLESISDVDEFTKQNFIITERKRFIMKSLPCKCLEYTRGGAYWRQDKSWVRFTHECVKRTQIANSERTQHF
jgi:hypothetical protein